MDDDFLMDSVGIGRGENPDFYFVAVKASKALEQSDSLLEQSVCFSFHLIAIAVQHSCF